MKWIIWFIDSVASLALELWLRRRGWSVNYTPHFGRRWKSYRANWYHGGDYKHFTHPDERGTWSTKRAVRRERERLATERYNRRKANGR